MTVSWDEEKHRQYQRRLGMLEEEEDRVRREDAKRLEYHEQLSVKLNRHVEQMHYSFESVASQVEGADPGTAHRAIENSVQETREGLRRALEGAVRAQEEHRQEFRRRFDALEQSYRYG